MKKALIIFGTIAILGLITYFAFSYFKKSTTPINDTPSVSFPTSGDSSPNQSTGSIQSDDFLQNPSILEDPVNPGYYYIGYKTFGPDAVENPPYQIEFIKETSYFNINIMQEPIGETRREAETYLMNLLGITKDQMCSLDYTVHIPHSVNSDFSSVNLGFSFCPGAVKLP